MPDHHRFAIELLDHAGEVVCYLPDGFARDHLGVGVALLDGVGIAWPGQPGGQRGVPGLLERCGPAIPAVR